MDRTDFEATDYHQGRDVMAKRKQGRPRAGTRRPTRGRKAAGPRAKARKRTAKRVARGARSRKKPARKAASGTRRSPARAAARKAPRKAKARTARKTRPRTAAAAKRPAAKPTAPRGGAPASSGKVLPKRPAGQHRLQLDRPRRVLEEPVAGPPSSLDFDRHASAARTGREELREARRDHTESSPRLTGGDVDANWASAFSTGDEAPGGDMPTPDQDVVEEIGSSLGVQYADDEELKAVDKIEQRDRHRWELDPASAEDYRDRGKKE